MRIVLPAGFMGNRPITGLATSFGLQGDFEITVNYEVVQEPQTVDAGDDGTRLTLGIVLNKSAKNLANFTRKVHTTRGPHYVAWSNSTDTDKAFSKWFPAKGQVGRLRLQRTEKDVSFHISEGSDKDFTLVQKFPIGSEE